MWLQHFLTCQPLYSNMLTAFISCKCRRCSCFWYLPIIVLFQYRQPDVRMQMKTSLWCLTGIPQCTNLFQLTIDILTWCLKFHFSQSRIELSDYLIALQPLLFHLLFLSSRWTVLASLACNQRVNAMKNNWSTLLLHDRGILELVLTQFCNFRQ